MPNLDAHKAVIARFQDLVRAPDPEAIRTLFTEDFQLHVPNYPDWPAGHEGALRMFNQVHARFPDLTLSAMDVFGEADRLCVRWRYQATGFDAVGVSIYRFVDGRIAEDWGVDAPLSPDHPWTKEPPR